MPTDPGLALLLTEQNVKTWACQSTVSASSPIPLSYFLHFIDKYIAHSVPDTVLAFYNINSLNFIKVIALLSLFYRRGNSSTERLNTLPAISQSPCSQTLTLPPDASVKQSSTGLFLPVHLAPGSPSTWSPILFFCSVNVPSSFSSHFFRVGSDISALPESSPQPPLPWG